MAKAVPSLPIRRTPLPERRDRQMFVYYRLITGDNRLSLLLANYYPSGMSVGRMIRGGNAHIMTNPETQRMIKWTVEDMADKAKKKIKVKRPKNIPEAQFETVEDVIATAEEVLMYLTACMRGQVLEECLMPRLCGAGEQVIERLKKQVTPKDRTKAAELLAKRYGLLESKLSVLTNAPVVFIGEGELKE